ncbi:MAG: DUF1361 domain-containing protein [Clostridia bacterium]|nr:DUF1361 domain-containing protein [Clostridia bacterium]
MQKIRFDRSALAIIGLLLLYFAVSVPVYLTHSLFLHHWLVWNVFLALLPPLFAWLFMHCRFKGLRLMLAVLWLLFFPNAPYLMTDMIHLAHLSFVHWGEGRELYPWLTLMQTGISIFLATTMGLWSLSVMHRAMRRWGGPVAGWLIVGLVCLASGYAVFMGRFLRFNSWDVLQPLRLLEYTARYTDSFAIWFSAGFGLYILFTYCIFRAFGALRATKTASSQNTPSLPNTDRDTRPCQYTS